MIKQESLVGKKGEILPKKLIRDAAGIKPGDKVFIQAYEGEIIIKKIYLEYLIGFFIKNFIKI